MTLSIFIAAVHLLALGIGLGSCLARGYALRNIKDVSGLKTVFFSEIVATVFVALGMARGYGFDLFFTQEKSFLSSF